MLISVLRSENVLQYLSNNLETFAVDDSGSRFVVFFLGDPHGLESGERGKDGATDPYGVFSLRGSNDLNLDRGWCEGGDFLLHTISNTRVHRSTTGQDIIGVQVLTDINVAPHDRVENSFVNTNRFHTDERWLEKRFGATESFITDGDDLTVGKFVGFLERRRGSGSSHLVFEVQGNVAKLFLDVTNDFSLSGGGEGVATFSHDLHEVGSQIATSQVQTEDGVGKSVPFVDGDGVRYTITRVENNTGGTTRGIQGEDSLDSDVHSWGSKSFEHNLGHLLSISFWIQRSLSKENW